MHHNNDNDNDNDNSDDSDDSDNEFPPSTSETAPSARFSMGLGLSVNCRCAAPTFVYTKVFEASRACIRFHKREFTSHGARASAVAPRPSPECRLEDASFALPTIVSVQRC